MQPPLWNFTDPSDPNGEGRPLTVREQFEVFHRLNPWVYTELDRMARELRAIGRRHLGMSCLVETLRFNFYRQTVDPNSEFKVNNNYKPHYARLLITEDPELESLFELRKLKYG